MTVLELVQRASARLDQAGVSFGHGTTNAWDEAAWLVLWRLGLALDALDASAACAVDPAQAAACLALIDERIASRRPAAYLTGEAWLQGVPFFADERAIVPRSLIAEVLAEGLVDLWLGREPQRVWDLCTGNGSLAVLAALAWPQAQVEASDLSADALQLAQRNVQRHALEDRIHLRQAHGLDGAQGPYDVVLCNPPYVPAAAMERLPAEYRAEPALALGGGADGMDLVRRIVAGLRTHLATDGWLVLEIGHERAHFEAAFPQLEPVWLPCSAGDDQVLALRGADLP